MVADIAIVSTVYKDIISTLPDVRKAQFELAKCEKEGGDCNQVRKNTEEVISTIWKSYGQTAADNDCVDLLKPAIVCFRQNESDCSHLYKPFMECVSRNQ